LLRSAPERWFRIQDWRSGARSQQIRRLLNKPGFVVSAWRRMALVFVEQDPSNHPETSVCAVLFYPGPAPVADPGRSLRQSPPPVPEPTPAVPLPESGRTLHAHSPKTKTQNPPPVVALRRRRPVSFLPDAHNRLSAARDDSILAATQPRHCGLRIPGYGKNGMP
jgi:hypothetical protein